jgi:D-arabinose 1-dehydrogenase-like Zn-dependent alcohol dehydrogenase
MVMRTNSHPIESHDPGANHGPARLDRRKFIVAGMGVAAAPLISGTSAAQADASVGADIELIRPDQINQAFERVVSKDIRYRFVIDVKSARA